MNILKNNWKYIVVFLIGLFLPLLVPFSPISNLVEKTSKYTKLKDDKIKNLELENAKIVGVNEHLIKEKTITDQNIKILQAKHDSLNIIVTKQDDVVKSYDDKQFNEIKKIDNFSEKELYNFYSNLK